MGRHCVRREGWGALIQARRGSPSPPGQGPSPQGLTPPPGSQFCPSPPRWESVLQPSLMDHPPNTAQALVLLRSPRGSRCVRSRTRDPGRDRLGRPRGFRGSGPALWGRGSLASGAGEEEGLVGPHAEMRVGRVRVGVVSGARPWLWQHTTPPGPRGVLGIFWKLHPTGGGPASRGPPCLDCPLGCRGTLMGTQAHFTDAEARPRRARAWQEAGQGSEHRPDCVEAKVLASSRLPSE